MTGCRYFELIFIISTNSNTYICAFFISVIIYFSFYWFTPRHEWNKKLFNIFHHWLSSKIVFYHFRHFQDIFHKVATHTVSSSNAEALWKKYIGHNKLLWSMHILLNNKVYNWPNKIWKQHVYFSQDYKMNCLNSTVRLNTGVYFIFGARINKRQVINIIF